MTEPERIDFIIKTVEKGKSADFAKKLGISEVTACRLRTGKIRIRNYITQILQVYPEVRREWLETGEGYPGDMTIDLVRQRYEDKISKADKIIDHLMRRIDELENVLQNGTNR